MALAFALLISKKVIHIRGWMGNYILAAIIAAISREKTVVEFMDIPEFLCDRKNYSYLYGADKTQDDFESVSKIFSCANGLLFNHHEKAIEKLKDKYKLNGKIMKFHNYVCNEFCSSRDVKLSRPVSIVYGGTIIPSSFPHSYFGDCQILPLIKKLTEKGLRIDVFGNPHIDMQEQYWDYVFESKRNPLFEIKVGSGPDKVTEKMSKYHFGLLMYLYEGVLAGRYHLMNLPTKLTLYLEAGLPILVSELNLLS